jgi:hypothetical protein
MAQQHKIEPTDCVFSGKIIVGDRVIEVLTPIPEGLAEELEVISAELKILRLRTAENERDKREEEEAREKQRQELIQVAARAGAASGAAAVGGVPSGQMFGLPYDSIPGNPLEGTPPQPAQSALGGAANSIQGALGAPPDQVTVRRMLMEQRFAEERRSQQNQEEKKHVASSPAHGR